MYLKHYNLTLKPFAISPDPKFLWLGKRHREALAAMKYGILDNKGFISLTGDVGTGKTTLVNALAKSLADNIILALVPEPSLEQLDFLNMTADAFKMDRKFSTKGDFLNHLKHFLNDAYARHKEVVLVIEEAQRFDQDRLEEVRLISNIEKPDKKLINIVFVGQNEFNSILINNKALRQRISIIHKIEPLQEIETEQYIMHRLKIAGSERKIFSPEAVREIYSFSEGNPRLINIICDFALLTGYSKDIKTLEPEIIRECAANCLTPKQQKKDTIIDLRASSKSIPETGTGFHPATSENSYQIVAKKVREKPARFKLAYIPPLFVVILLSILGYLYFVGENRAPYREFKTFVGQAFEPNSGSKSETSSPKRDEISIQQTNLAGTQVRALDLKTQKTSIEIQLGQLRSSYEKLAAEFEALKITNAHVAELESVAAMREQTLSQSEQKVTDLTHALDREKKGQELLRAEFSTKANLVAELQQKLEATLSRRSELENDIEKSKNDFLELQGQLLDLKAQKASFDTQLGQMRTRNEALTADLEELKGTNERVVALEGEVASRDQALSGAEQRLSQLAKELDIEKQSGERLSTKLSTKVNLIAELEQKLAATLSNRSELEINIEESKKEIAELQVQLLDAKAQKGSSENQLEQFRSSYEKLNTDLKELKGAKQRVTVLEGELATRDKVLSGSEQRLSQLAKELDQEKESRVRLSSDLSSKVNLIAELQKKLANAQSNAMDFEAEINNSTIKINELQEQLKGLKSQQAPAESSKEIAALQEQISELKAQKASSDTQLGQLKSRNEKLTADLAELKRAKERVAELEQVAARREQTFSASEQKVTGLANALDREKKGQNLLRAELSTKADRVAALQQKLEATVSSRSILENDIEKGKNQIAELQSQITDLKAQKTSSDTQLDQLRSRYEAITDDLNELKGAKKRVASLEGELSMKDQALSRSVQKLSQLAKELDQEKKNRELLRSEISKKADLVSAFQQKLQTSQANQQELEETLNQSKKEIAALQNQIGEIQSQPSPTKSAPVIVDLKEKPTLKSEASGEQVDSLSPTDVIDWLLKKKAK